MDFSTLTMHRPNDRYERLVQSSHVNLDNKADADGFVRGSCLPEGVDQAPLSRAVALITLFTFISWPYFMFWLFVASALYPCGPDGTQMHSRLGVALRALFLRCLLGQLPSFCQFPCPHDARRMQAYAH